MGHDHSHGSNKKTLFISFIIITSYMIVEAIGGIVTNSLALLSDAGHMLSDSISLAVALVAFTLGEKAANSKKTFGYKRFEVLAAVLNGVTLVFIALFIFYEAIQRFIYPPQVASSGMLIIAIIGLFVNIVIAWVMLRGGDTKENLNVRAAYLHVISDMLGSVAAIVAALLILFFNWSWADPLASVIVAVLVCISGVRVTNSALHILMEGTPSHVDVAEIAGIIESVNGVKRMYDLHVWMITSGQNMLSCHVVVNDALTVKDTGEISLRIKKALGRKGIDHVTIQMESEEYAQFHQHEH